MAVITEAERKKQRNRELNTDFFIDRNPKK